MVRRGDYRPDRDGPNNPSGGDQYFHNPRCIRGEKHLRCGFWNSTVLLLPDCSSCHGPFVSQSGNLVAGTDDGILLKKGDDWLLMENFLNLR